MKIRRWTPSSVLWEDEADKGTYHFVPSGPVGTAVRKVQRCENKLTSVWIWVQLVRELLLGLLKDNGQGSRVRDVPDIS